MSYDAIVLGTGAVGSAALWQLARRGLRVLGLDRFPPGHDRGSSHGETRVIRQAYFEHADYVPLLLRSYDLWHELEAESGRELFIQTGLVQVGPPDGEVVPGVLRAAREHDLAVEALDPAVLERRFPMLRAPEGSAAVFEATGGILRVEACVTSAIEMAKRRGAEHRVVTATAWRKDGDGVVVETETESFRAQRLLLAGGAWSSQLLAGHSAGLPLKVLRKPLYWFGGVDASWAAERGAPVFLFEEAEGIFYGFPSLEPGVLKVAEHTGGAPVPDPLTVDRSVWPSETERVEAFTRRSLAGVGGGVLRHAVCMYTMSPDGHFVVDRHEAHPAVVYAAGLSGHGFKMASVLGEALVELAIDGASRLPIEFLSARRFSAA